MPPSACKYKVCEVLQPTWTQSRPANTKCAAGAGFGPAGYALTVTSGFFVYGNGSRRYLHSFPTRRSSDLLNANGVKDVGEPGLAGWTISAYTDGNGDGTLSATEAV